MAVIFDMDGVLFDSEPLHIRAWQAMLEPLGCRLEREWFLPWIGIPDWKVAACLHAEFGLGKSGDDLLQQKRTQYVRITAEELHPFDGVETAVRRLLAHGVPIAVATLSSADNTLHTLTCTGLAALFPVRVTGDDVTRHKPEPDPFLQAAAFLGTAPELCTVVEDSPAGIQAARAAGCTVLAVTTSHTPDNLSGADHIFRTTLDAIHWVLAQRAGAGK